MKGRETLKPQKQEKKTRRKRKIVCFHVSCRWIARAMLKDFRFVKCASSTSYVGIKKLDDYDATSTTLFLRVLTRQFLRVLRSWCTYLRRSLISHISRETKIFLFSLCPLYKSRVILRFRSFCLWSSRRAPFQTISVLLPPPSTTRFSEDFSFLFLPSFRDQLTVIRHR